MTKSNYTHLSLVVDRSGSMSSIREDAEGGINSLIKEQTALPGKLTVTLYQFDDSYDKVFGPIDASEAPTYNLVPRGMTGLLDAVGKSVVETGQWLKGLSESERPSKVIFVIVTDGGENASKEYKKPRIKEMVENQESQWSWEFMFLGANIDAFSEAAGMGMRNSTQYSATKGATRKLYANASYALGNSRIGGQSMASSMASNIDDDTDVQTIEDLKID